MKKIFMLSGWTSKEDSIKEKEETIIKLQQKEVVWADGKHLSSLSCLALSLWSFLSGMFGIWLGLFSAFSFSCNYMAVYIAIAIVSGAWCLLFSVEKAEKYRKYCAGGLGKEVDRNAMVMIGMHFCQVVAEHMVQNKKVYVQGEKHAHSFLSVQKKTILGAGVGMIAAAAFSFLVFLPFTNQKPKPIQQLGAILEGKAIEFLVEYMPAFSGGKEQLKVKTTAGGVVDGSLGQEAGYSLANLDDLLVTSTIRPTETIYLKGYVGSKYQGNKWAEIYLSGYGWVPVETTPGNIGVLQTITREDELEAQESTDTQEDSQVSEIDNKFENMPPEDREEADYRKKVNGCIFGTLLAGMILIVLIIFIKRIRREQKKRGYDKKESTNERISSIFSLMYKKMEQAGMPENITSTSEEFRLWLKRFLPSLSKKEREGIIALVLESSYGNRAMTEEDVDWMRRIYRKTLVGIRYYKKHRKNR